MSALVPSDLGETSILDFDFRSTFSANFAREIGQTDAEDSASRCAVAPPFPASRSVRPEISRLMCFHLAALDPECQMWLLISSHVNPPEGFEASQHDPREHNNWLTDICPHPPLFPHELLFRNHKDAGKIRGEGLS